MQARLWAVLLVVSTMLAGLAGQAGAAPLIVGDFDTTNAFPFGATSGPNAYLGEYQQVFRPEYFAGPALITQIAFASAPGSGGTLSTSFTLSLGTTGPATQEDYNANKRADFTTVFSGTVTAALSSGADFDFVIDLSTPFAYDPSLGSLLLDAFVIDSSGPGSLFKATRTSGAVRVFNLGGTGAPMRSSEMLLTRFDGEGLAPGPGPSVPEPAVVSLLGLGLVAAVRRTR